MQRRACEQERSVVFFVYVWFLPFSLQACVRVFFSDTDRSVCECVGFMNNMVLVYMLPHMYRGIYDCERMSAQRERRPARNTRRVYCSMCVCVVRISISGTASPNVVHMHVLVVAVVDVAVAARKVSGQINCADRTRGGPSHTRLGVPHDSVKRERTTMSTRFMGIKTRPV